MFTEMETTGSKIKSIDVKNLESEIGMSLPQSYKDFLIKFNGGEPVERAIDFKAEKKNQTGDYVASFYEISNDVSYSISKNMENHGDKIPKGLIYIASSPAGNYYLLSLRNDSYGEVYYKDHELEDSLPFNPTNGILPESIVKISRSFDDFLANLYDPDDT